MLALKPYQQRVEALLHRHFHPHCAPDPLASAMRYAALDGGKRIRAALVWLTGEACGLTSEPLDPAAMAIELVHAYSLVHDDLPAMDDDDLRRDKPTVHRAFDEATAILAGDALLNEAFELLAHADELDDTVRLRQLRTLTAAAGSCGMVAGQMLDVETTGKPVSQAELEHIHTLKTGRLIQAALLMGAAPSTDYATLAPALETLGERLGLAFQVHDDILDVEQSSETLGKPAGSDTDLNKNTFPALMGLEAAKAYRDELIADCHHLLDTLPFRQPVFHQLIDYIAKRSH